MAKRVGTLLQRRRRFRAARRCDSARNDRKNADDEQARLESGRPAHEGGPYHRNAEIDLFVHG